VFYVFQRYNMLSSTMTLSWWDSYLGIIYNKHLMKWNKKFINSWEELITLRGDRRCQKRATWKDLSSQWDDECDYILIIIISYHCLYRFCVRLSFNTHLYSHPVVFHVFLLDHVTNYTNWIANAAWIINLMVTSAFFQTCNNVLMWPYIGLI